MPPDWQKTIFSKTLIYRDFRLRAVNSQTARKRKYPNRQKIWNSNTSESFTNGTTYFRKYKKPWNFDVKFHTKTLILCIIFFGTPGMTKNEMKDEKVLDKVWLYWHWRIPLTRETEWQKLEHTLMYDEYDGGIHSIIVNNFPLAWRNDCTSNGYKGKSKKQMVICIWWPSLWLHWSGKGGRREEKRDKERDLHSD